jgi:hypothetical protein
MGTGETTFAAPRHLYTTCRFFAPEKNLNTLFYLTNFELCQCLGSGATWARIDLALTDPDPDPVAVTIPKMV